MDDVAAGRLEGSRAGQHLERRLGAEPGHASGESHRGDLLSGPRGIEAASYPPGNGRQKSNRAPTKSAARVPSGEFGVATHAFESRFLTPAKTVSFCVASQLAVRSTRFRRPGCRRASWSGEVNS